MCVIDIPVEQPPGSEGGGRRPVQLRDILRSLPAAYQRMQWSVLSLWAVAEPEAQLDLPSLEAEIERSDSGLALDTAGLYRLADSIAQVIDGVFVADPARSPVSKVAADDLLYQSHALVIEANDSTYWRIASQSEEVCAALKATFRGARDVSFPSRRGQ